MTRSRRTQEQSHIMDPFVLHEGRHYILCDWYSKRITANSVLLLHPLSGDEVRLLLSMREANHREAYASILPMVRRRAGLDPLVIVNSEE